MSGIFVISDDTGLCKIGVSANVTRRMRALKNGADLTLEYVRECGPKHRKLEGEVHRRLEKHRSHGEWFSVTPQVAIEAIERVANETGTELREDHDLTPVMTVTLYLTEPEMLALSNQRRVGEGLPPATETAKYLFLQGLRRTQWKRWFKLWRMGLWHFAKDERRQKGKKR